MWSRDLVRRFPSREVLTFLAVGGAGYIVDVATFNLLRTLAPFNTLDPTVARTMAVAVAMCVTYAGNSTMTWHDHTSGNRRREVGLFVLFNIIGFGFSVVTLAVSHDLLGLTSRLADNVSANLVGLALGTVFRYLTYKHFVFELRPTTSRTPDLHAAANTPPPEPDNRDVLVG